MEIEREKAVYTHRQLCEMMEITRSWTLNNPAGPLPYIPAQWVDYVSDEENRKAHLKTRPPHKSPHKIIKLLMWLKIFRHGARRL